MKCLNDVTLKGILADCNPNLAGIAEAWLGYNGDFTIVVDETGRTVTTITAASGATSGKFYHYTFAKQTGSLTSTLTKDEAAGTRYWTNAIVLQFSKLEAAKHIEVEAMAAEQLVGIIKDNNGKYWLVGYDGYLSADDGSVAQTGASYDDMNGYTVNMSAMSGYLPFEIQYSQFSELVG